MDLNTRIQKIIEYSMLSASEFADEIGVQRSNISHIISGRNKPSLDFIMKIKDRFPEIEWEWMIEGKGNMVSSSKNIQGSKINLEENEEIEKQITPIPDLFNLMEETHPLASPMPKHQEQEEKSEVSNSRDLNISTPIIEKEKISDSQPLEVKESVASYQLHANQENKIKRIVIFFESGKFESFEP